jgi:hypothetical protein
VQFSDSNDKTNVDNDLHTTEPNGDDYVTRADFDALARKVDDLETRSAERDAAYELSSTSDDFGGLTRDEFLQELADNAYGKGVRPVRPGQFDVKSNGEK